MIMTLGDSEYVIHHPSRVEVYAVTKEQLELISIEGKSDWESRYQSAFSVLITCLINIIALGWDTGSMSFRLNVAIGALASILGAISLGLYMKDKRRQGERLKEIFKQPIQSSRLEEEPMQ